MNTGPTTILMRTIINVYFFISKKYFIKVEIPYNANLTCTFTTTSGFC